MVLLNAIATDKVWQVQLLYRQGLKVREYNEITSGSDDSQGNSHMDGIRCQNNHTAKLGSLETKVDGRRGFFGIRGLCCRG